MQYTGTVNWDHIVLQYNESMHCSTSFSSSTEPIGHWYSGQLPEPTCRYSRARSSLAPVRLGLHGLHPSVINTEENKKVLGSSKRTSRLGLRERMVRSHTVWSSKKGYAFEASSWDLYGVISHLQKNIKDIKITKEKAFVLALQLVTMQFKQAIRILKLKVTQECSNVIFTKGQSLSKYTLFCILFSSH